MTIDVRRAHLFIRRAQERRAWRVSEPLLTFPSSQYGNLRLGHLCRSNCQLTPIV